MSLTVRTSLGEIQGKTCGNHREFLGVPFAAPPTGSGRFCAPAPHEGWTGVRDATRFGFSCPQGQHPIPGMAASGPRSEDCLYLNVFTPAAAGAQRPVMVWIHGGGFTMGSASELLYHGGPLVERGDVVVVAIQYRLGALGYLYLGAHGGEAWGATANAGQRDQVAALEWVRDNIAAFGGDPGNVTIFGESAGSAAVATLLAMPAAKGLFHRAIMESGAANLLAGSQAASRVTTQLLAELGSDGSQGSLQGLPADRIVEAQLSLTARAQGLDAGLRLAPVVDGKTVPVSPLEAVANGSSADVPVLIGSNRDEAKLFNVTVRERPQPDDAALVEALRPSLPGASADRITMLAGTYRTSRESRGLPHANNDILDAVQSDVRFRLPSIRLAEAQRKNQSRTFSYLFTHTSPARHGALGACHALEIPFVFGTLDAPTQDRFAGSGPEVERLSGHMMAAWLAFARTGNPSHEGLGEWPAYDAEERRTMILDLTSRVESDPFGNEREALETVVA